MIVIANVKEKKVFNQILWVYSYIYVFAICCEKSPLRERSHLYRAKLRICENIAVTLNTKSALYFWSDSNENRN